MGIKQGVYERPVEIWTDGSCAPSNPGPGGWSAILVAGDYARIVAGQGAKKTTNIAMELTAVVEGLKRLKQPCMVTIVTDSKYVVDGMTKLKTQGTYFKSHKGLWQQIKHMLNQHVSVDVLKTPAHSPMTQALNHLADYYANLAANRRITLYDQATTVNSAVKRGSYGRY
jgi:ribonuclease HI